MFKVDSNESPAELVKLFVTPDSIGEGIGTLMLNFFENEVKKYNLPIFIWALKDNKFAENFYIKNGYKQDIEKINNDWNRQSIRYVKTIK
jgi:GNAT superfamily N-acetyltransferase